MGKRLRLMLKQSIGAAAIPVADIRVGGRVKRGALLAVPEKLGVSLHASAGGVIAEVTEHYIDIDADDVQSAEYVPIAKSDSLVDMVKDAGLCGMGGAGFPTYAKLATDLRGGVLIVNSAECEPLLNHNIQQLTREPEKVCRGMELAIEATRAARGILAIKSKHVEAIKAFRAVLSSGKKAKIQAEIHELPDLYPMGEERAVVREALGELLGVDQLPSAANAVVINLETAARIAEIVDHRRPIMSKNLTVAGKLGQGPESRVFMDVPLGTRFSDLLEECGGIEGSYGEIIAGGPFTGAGASLESIVCKTTGGVLVTQEFLREKRPLGLLVCACGGNETRLRELAGKMEAQVVSVRRCKQAQEVKGTLKCENPGNCPGQAEKIMELKKEGAQALLVSNCSDCTNTVMCVAPKLKMAVHHATDHAMRAVGHSLVRRLPID
jgi:proline reductase-associated electron transfer protein PrdC